jgi:hypothetical protein
VGRSLIRSSVAAAALGALALQSGARVRADFGSLGEVVVRFGEREHG